METKGKQMEKVTFQNGNKEVEISVLGSADWSSGNKSRRYFELSCTGKRSPVSKLYEVLSGDTKDHTLTHGSRTFAFEYGIDANSKSKRKAVTEALAELVAKL